jgi:hypothetical protein
MFFVLLSICDVTFGQQYYVKGYIKDSITFKPIPYVNISIKGFNRGTVSNDKGFFYFVFTQEELTDSLNISCVGYFSKSYLLQSINGKEMIINMLPKTFELSEVIIRSKSPEELLRQAIRNVPKKFNNDNSTQIALYKETICQYQNGDSTIRSIIAAVGINNLEFVDNKTKSNKNTLLYGVYKSEDNLTHYNNIYARLPNLLRWTIESNCLEYISDYNILNPKKNTKYLYRFSDSAMVGENNSKYVKIIISPKSFPSSLSEGTVYINMVDTVITRIELFHSIRNIPRKEDNIYKNLDSIVYSIVEPTSLIVEYKKIKNKYFLSYIRQKIKIGDYYSDYLPFQFDSYETELTIIGKDLINRFKTTPVIIDKKSDLYYLTSINDKDFWDRFNFMIKQP